MSGLLLRFVLLVVAVALTGTTAFTVASSDPPTRPFIESPEALSGHSLPGDAVSTSGTIGPVDHGELADDSLGGVSRPVAPGTTRVSLAFAGDILIHGNLRSRASVADGEFDFRPMFEGIRPALESADLAICHLEVPLTSTNTGLSTYPRFNAPHEVAEAIAHAGFDGCSTASNHSFDQGTTGLVDTLDILDAAGVAHAGTARTPEEAASATLYEIEGGPTVAHIAATYWLNGLRTPEGQDWLAQRIDLDRIVDMAREARWQLGADLVVVSIHCCTEYRVEPTPDQVATFDALIRSEWVDLVVGHHSHVVGPADVIGGEFVVYGLGNLISGQLHRTDTREGVIAFATAEWSERGWRFVGVSALPTFVESGTYTVVPVGPESGTYARTMAALGAYGAQITPFEMIR